MSIYDSFLVSISTTPGCFSSNSLNLVWKSIPSLFIWTYRQTKKGNSTNSSYFFSLVSPNQLYKIQVSLPFLYMQPKLSNSLRNLKKDFKQPLKYWEAVNASYGLQLMKRLSPDLSWLVFFSFSALVATGQEYSAELPNFCIYLSSAMQAEQLDETLQEIQVQKRAPSPVAVAATLNNFLIQLQTDLIWLFNGWLGRKKKVEKKSKKNGGREEGACQAKEVRARKRRQQKKVLKRSQQSMGFYEQVIEWRSWQKIKIMKMMGVRCYQQLRTLLSLSCKHALKYLFTFRMMWRILQFNSFIQWVHLLIGSSQGMDQRHW